MAETVTIPESDVLAVRSRVSWGAVFAGAVVALAIHFVLTLLGSAVGLSVGDDVGWSEVGIGATVWAILATILALFAGGWVTSQAMAGENRKEAAVHGIIMWGLVFAIVMWLISAGIRSGFNAMVGTSYAGVAAESAGAQNWQTGARQAGVSQEQINQWQQTAGNATAGNTAEGASAEEASDTAAAVAWWTLLGVILSLAAAVGGAIVGSGPSFRLLGVSYPAAHSPVHSRMPQRPAGA